MVISECGCYDHPLPTADTSLKPNDANEALELWLPVKYNQYIYDIYIYIYIY